MEERRQRAEKGGAQGPVQEALIARWSAFSAHWKAHVGPIVEERRSSIGERAPRQQLVEERRFSAA
jgi:hypothetical protein